MNPPAGPLPGPGPGKSPDAVPDERGSNGRGSDGRAPNETPGPAGPFDEHGRLVGARHRPRTGSLPVRRTASGSIPLGWSHSGPIPLNRASDASGGLTLTGGISFGRRKKPVALRFDPIIRGRGLARLSRHPQPTTASELQRATARWVVTLWAMIILFQRFQLPNQEVALVLPLTIVWCIYGVVRGVAEVDTHRFAWWMGATGLSAAVVPFQYALVDRAFVSLTSWGLIITTWIPFIFRLRDRRKETYLLALRGIVKVCMWFALLVIIMMASQLVIPYQDWFADIIPESIRLKTFTIAYPITYGSPYYKANGWIGLEPSVVSFQLGLGLVAALLIRSTMPVVLLLGTGILCTTAGSGVIIVAVAVPVIIFSAYRWALARYLILIPPVLAFAATPWAEPIVKRTSEFTGGTGSNTSTNLRAIAPYDVLWPRFIEDPFRVLFGGGPGSSAEIITNQHILGLLVPTPLKIFYDYGVVAGLALATFLLFMYLGGPSRAIAITLGVSLWTLQPGTTTMVFVVVVPLMVTWWTPRLRGPLESDHIPSPNASIAPVRGSQPRMEVRT
jgi:hypothetical protein